MKWIVNSRTRPGVSYTVTLRKDGSIGCNCPKWIFKKGKKEDCHHIKAIKKEYFLNMMKAANSGGETDIGVDWYKV